MNRIFTILAGGLIASLLAPHAIAQTTTLHLEGIVRCATNGVDPVMGGCAPLPFSPVDPSIRGVFGPGPASSFAVEVTLPDQQPAGTSPTGFPNQTRYVVPVGDYALSVDVGGFAFAPNGSSHPFPGAGDHLNVAVTNDETFGNPNIPPPGIDTWGFSTFGSDAAVQGAHFCDVSFVDPTATNLVSQDYFVVDGLQGENAPWYGSIRCQVFFENPGGFPPYTFVPVMWGDITSFSVTRDGDGDGIADDDDNCPDIANSNQNDLDGDGTGDACDDDVDGDQVSNDLDNCTFDANADQADADGDGAGDVCDDDADGDGVLDAIDACVPSPIGAVVDADGCAIAELCPCEHPIGGDKWKNHGGYVSCVTHASEDFVSEGLISEEEKDAIVSEAGASTCGHKEK